MSTWTAHTTVAAEPRAVLDVLTDPSAIERWSPIPFTLDELHGRRLDAGTTARVSGPLARFGESFDPACGLTGRLLAQATEALLRAGALERALGRIAQEIEDTQPDGRTEHVEHLC